MAVAETPTANVDKAAIKARNFIVSRNMKLLGNCEGRRGAGVDCLQCLPLLYTTDTGRQLYTASTRRPAGHLVLASRSAAVGCTAQLRSMCMRM